MKRLLLNTLLVICFLLASGTATLANPTKLFEEAVARMQAAKTADSYTEAYDSYQSARENIERILEEYDKSDIADGLITCQKRIARFTLEEFRGLEPILQFRSRAELDPLTTALLVAERTTEAGVEDDLKTYISRILSKAGRFDEALEIGESIHLTDQYSALLWITEGLFAAGEREKATELMFRVLKSAESEQRKTWRSMKLESIMDRFSSLADQGDSRKLLEKALLLALEIEEKRSYWNPRDALLNDIVKAFLGIGQITRAEEISLLIKSQTHRLLSTIEIAKAYARTGRLDKGIALLLQVTDMVEYLEKDSDRFQVLTSVAVEYAAIDQFKEALQIVETIDHKYRKDKALAGISMEYLKKDLFTEAVKTATMITDPGFKSETLLNLAGVLIDAGHYGEAFHCFGAAATAVNYTFSGYRESQMAKKCIDSLIKTGELDSAQIALNKFFLKEDEGWKDDVLAQFATSYSQIGQIDLALKTAELIRREEGKVKAWVAIAVAYRSSGKVEMAQQLFDAAKSAALEAEFEYPRSEALTEISRGYLSIGDFTRAIETAGMIEVLTEKSRILAEIAVDYLKKGRNLNESEKAQLQKLVQDLLPLRRHLTSPDEVREKIDFLMRVKMKKAASYGEFSELYTDVQRELKFLSREYQWVESAPWSYRGGFDKEIIRGFSIDDINDLWDDFNPMYEAEQDPLNCSLFIAKQIGDPSRQIQALLKIASDHTKFKKKEEVDRIYSVAMKLISQIRDKSEAIGYLNEIACDYAVIDEKMTSSAIFKSAIETAKLRVMRDPLLKEISESCLKAGLPEEALLANRWISNQSIRSSFLITISNKYVEMGQFEKAMDVIESMHSASAKNVALGNLAIGLIDEDKSVEVEETIAEISHLYVTGSSALKNISIKYAECGQYENAVKQAQAISDSRIRSSALARIGKICFDKGQENDSQRLLSKAYQIAEASEPILPLLMVLQEIAEEFGAVGRHDMAMKVLCRARDVARNLKYEKYSGLRIVAGGFFKVGQKELGTEMLSEASAELRLRFKDTYIEFEEIGNIAVEYAKAGLLPSAVNTVCLIKTAGIRDRYLTMISREFAQKYDLEKAHHLIESIQNERLRYGALANIFNLYIDRKEINKASKLLPSMLETVTKIDSDWYRFHLLGDIADKYAQLKNFKEARKITELVLDNDQKAKALSAVARRYLDVNDFTGSLSIANEIQDKNRKSSILHKIAEGYAESNQMLGALTVAANIEDAFSQSLVINSVSKNLAEEDRSLSGTEKGVLRQIVQHIYPVTRFWKEAFE